VRAAAVATPLLPSRQASYVLTQEGQNGLESQLRPSFARQRVPCKQKYKHAVEPRQARSSTTSRSIFSTLVSPCQSFSVLLLVCLYPSCGRLVSCAPSG